MPVSDRNLLIGRKDILDGILTVHFRNSIIADAQVGHKDLPVFIGGEHPAVVLACQGCASDAKAAARNDFILRGLENFQRPGLRLI